MGAFHPEPIQPLGPEECWALLEGVPVGRLVVVMAGEPDVFPVNFAVDDRGLVVRTDIGMKFFAAEQRGRAALEVDHWDAETGFTVVARGTLRVLTDPAERAHAESLDPHPWLDTPKAHLIRLDVEEITGRRFTLNDAARAAQAGG